jgi:ABC-type glycerol-3-phosphate transport system permease component
MAAWDNFLWPLLVIQDEKKATLPFLLQLLAMKQNQNWHLVMTGIVIAAIPMLIFFLLLQKYIVKGYVMSGIKF